MVRYYTRVCNFYYGSKSKKFVKEKKTLPLNGNKEISFDKVEIISRNFKKKISIKKIDDLHKIAKALMTYETLTGEEIENIITKNIYPADKQNLKVDDDKSSALGAMGLKPKIVH